MCFALEHRPPSLFVSLQLNEMLADVKVVLQVNEVFKGPPTRAAVQGEAARWGEVEFGRLRGE